jgi:DNA replication protein DnaC
MIKTISTNNVSLELMIDSSLKELKMPAIARDYRSLIREAETEGQSYETFLVTLLRQEIDNREKNRFKQLLRNAQFPNIKTLAEFDFSQQPSIPVTKVLGLAKAEFLKKGESLCCLGPPGTGKTHLASAIGLCCIEKGEKVKFVTVTALANDLLAARDSHILTKVLRRWRSYSLVIIDELGFVPLSREGAQVLFHFLSDRYEKHLSLIITSNLEFSRWIEIFHDSQLTSALLDRLLHHCTILEHSGDSFRFKESLKRKLQDCSSS